MHLCDTFAMLALSLLLLLVHHAHKGTNADVNDNQIRAINRYMDVLTDPCDNYYRYACGNWGKVHTNENYVEITSFIDHKVNKRLIHYFQNYALEGSAEAGNHTYTDKLFLYYQTCRRAHKQLKRYLQLVRPSAHLDWQLMLEMREPNATWPARRFNWLFTLAKLRRYNFKGGFFEHAVMQSERYAKRFVIDLDKPVEKLPDMLEILALLIMLGVEKMRAFEVATRLHSFENSLKVLRSIPDNEGPQLIALDELERIMPRMPWRLYLQLVLSYTLTTDYEVQINNIDYFNALSEHLQQTEPSLIDNYIMVKFAYFLLNDGAADFSKVSCVTDVRKKLDLAVNFLYKQQFLDSSNTKVAADVERIFEATKREFAAKLTSNRMQLQPQQLDHLQRKLTAMRYNIGNLPASINERHVDAYYVDVHINTDAYYKNHLALLKLRTRREHDQLTAPTPAPSEYYYIGEADSCTPLYLYRRNVVIIPYAFLQPPAYHVNMHDILKMGIFGFVLTHEIMHGFESSGLRYDASGEVAANGDTILSGEQFNAALTCLEQTDSQSIDERMADFLAIRVAYDTLFGANSSMNAHWPSHSDITPKRLFFLTIAQFFCGNLRGTFLDHDSDDVRLQQTFMQFEPFAAEYECRRGDRMYLEDRTETLPGNPSYKATMRLTITNVQKSDYGSYKCVAKNPRGEMDGTIKLYMSSPPTTLPPPTTTTTRRTTIAPAWDSFSTPIYGIMPTNSVIVIDKMGTKYQSNLNEIGKSEQKLTGENPKGYDWSKDKSAAARMQLWLPHAGGGGGSSSNKLTYTQRICCNYAMLIALVGMLLTTWLQTAMIKATTQTATTKTTAAAAAGVANAAAIDSAMNVEATTPATAVVLSAAVGKTIREVFTANALAHTRTPLHVHNALCSISIAYKQA